MDLTTILSEFIDEMLGLHSAYALTDIDSFESAGDAEAFVRLRVRVCEALLAEGWQPNTDATAQLERDRLLLSEADDDGIPVAPSRDEDRAALRARAARVVEDSVRVQARADRQRQATVDAKAEIEQMRHALASRAVIEQAKGIAMERYGLTAEVAWSWLVRTSQSRNVKLRVIAQELVDSVVTSHGGGGVNGATASTSTPSA